MARTLSTRQSQTDDELIEAHLEPDAYWSTADEWRLKERGVPVWAIIGFLLPDASNAEQVARDYGVSSDAVAAAIAYYRRHRAEIDARLAQNRAA
ncbi:MAG: DUF433 domain-containing protein [Thermomicrobiales bacterium]